MLPLEALEPGLDRSEPRVLCLELRGLAPQLLDALLDEQAQAHARHDFGWLAVAFCVRGLKEFGEPARKALIIGQAVPELRSRTYGAYYLIRDCVVTSGSFLGAWLWSLSPEANFFGAAALGDIGEMFPDTDVANKGKDSTVMLSAAVARLHHAGWRVGNVDITVVTQRPKIGPHRAAIRARLAELLEAVGVTDGHRELNFGRRHATLAKTPASRSG